MSAYRLMGWTPDYDVGVPDGVPGGTNPDVCCSNEMGLVCST